MTFTTRVAFAAASVIALAGGTVATAAAFDVGPYDRDVVDPPSADPTRTNNGDSPAQLEYVPVTPCRVVDSRFAAAGKLSPGAIRSWQVTGTTGFPIQGGKSGGCGIPAAATSAVVSLSATSSTGNGYLRAWRFGSSEPTATALNYSDLGGGGITTGATVPINGYVNVHNYGASTHVIIDVTGYYVEPIAADVSSGGSLLSNSKTITAATRTGEGSYRLDSTQDLDDCAVVAVSTLSTHNVAAQSVGDVIYVYSREVNDTSAYVDTSFSVTVTC